MKIISVIVFILSLSSISLGQNNDCAFCENLKKKSQQDYDYYIYKFYDVHCFLSDTIYHDSKRSVDRLNATTYTVNTKNLCNTYFSAVTYNIKSKEIISGFEIENNDTILLACEDMQEMVNDQIFNHFSKNIYYPSECRRKGIEGTVYLKFILDEHGEVKDVFVIIGPHRLLIEEAKRLVNSLPKLKPIKCSGNPVKMRLQIPVKFRLI